MHVCKYVCVYKTTWLPHISSLFGKRAQNFSFFDVMFKSTAVYSQRPRLRADKLLPSHVSIRMYTYILEQIQLPAKLLHIFFGNNKATSIYIFVYIYVSVRMYIYIYVCRQQRVSFLTYQVVFEKVP